jgi:superfamily II RNA helicase
MNDDVAYRAQPPHLRAWWVKKNSCDHSVLLLPIGIRRPPRDDAAMTIPLSLAERLPASGHADPDDLLELFLAWTAEQGLTLYPAQEEAILEVMAGSHVILATPTGSGKSLVATASHFRTLGTRGRAFYTSPIKALVSEKFFACCEELGPENVGLMTGDATVNRDARIICCTAEVLASMALREGEAIDAATVVMDEFHFYGDPERGMAWQLPLLLLPHTTFLLMSATLGDTTRVEEGLNTLTGKAPVVVASDERPVPLKFTYTEEPLHETIQTLVTSNKAPVYLVHFTQRACAEQAQALTSVALLSKEERKTLAAAIGGFAFDSPYGKEISRYLRHGVGLHHGGLLPKYRLLVERLARKGLLKVICGTDTLGVGVNVPIRTVLFTQLSKFDGERSRNLRVREFKQIAGRAGRRGFDDIGYVVCQAPAHVVENRRLAAKAALQRGKKLVRAKPPKGFVPWDEKTFQGLIADPPEVLESTFRVNHGLLLALLQRDPETLQHEDGYGMLLELIERSHTSEGASERLRQLAQERLDELIQAGIVVVQEASDGRSVMHVNETLQTDFSLMHTLSLFLVGALETLSPDAPSYALDLLSFVEATLENPRAILYQQERQLKDTLIAQWKADGVEYEERMTRLEKVTWPKPCADQIYGIYNLFAEGHPWVAGEHIRPKSIARDLFERYMSFDDYIRELGLQRIEGVVLRYLNTAYKTLLQTVPDAAKTETVYDLEAFLRTTLERVDSSLLREWERMTQAGAPDEQAEAPVDISAEPRAFKARLRSELHLLVRCLAHSDFEAAERSAHQMPDDPWPATRFEEDMAAFVEAHGPLGFDHQARLTEHTVIEEAGPHQWRVTQTLLGSDGPTLVALQGFVDLRPDTDPVGPLIALWRIG